MKLAGRLLLTTSLVAAASLASPAAFAADVQAVPAPDTGWYTHGDLDFGWRTFIERPPAAPSATDPQRNNRAGFEQYGQISPGPFLDYLYFGAGSRDGRYSFDFFAKDVGYNDQSYLLELDKPGEHYLALGWDQSPYFYGVGTSIWAVNGNSLLTGLKFPSTFTTNAAALGSTANQTAINKAVLANGPMNIGIRRDTASVAYRYTPTADWDFHADYSHQQRTGTLPQWGIIETTFGAPSVQLPKPVNDTTQDVKASGEYAGYTFWGSKYNLKISGGGSFYQDDFSQFTWQNPFGNGTCTAALCLPSQGFMSTPPDNQAYIVTATAGVDLPFNSRYMGTLSYQMMRQNEAFGPETVSPVVVNQATPAAVVSASTIPGLPASSLNGAINTFLSNNVIYTQLTSDLKSTFKARYYDYDNQTPRLTFNDYVLADVTLKNMNGDLPRSNLVVSYVKSNVSEDLNWHPNRWWNLGGTVGWERWDRDHMDANVTDELTGKVYTDAHIADAALVRASVQYGQRRYDKYDYLDYVARDTYDSWVNGLTNPNCPSGGTAVGACETVNSSLMRMFDMANRNRTQGKVQVDLFGPVDFTVTPNFGFKNDNYDVDPTIGTYGVKHDNSFNGGVDLAYTPVRGITLMASYTREQHNEELLGVSQNQNSGTGVNATPSVTYDATMRDTVDTYTAAVNLAVVPNSVDFKVSYSYSHDREDWDTTVTQFTSAPTIAPFPQVKNDYQRLDAVLKYRVDPDVVHKVGFWGDVVAKLQYTWERNAVSNWQDLNTPDVFFVDNSATRMISLAADNPNYNAQMIMASLALKW